MRANDAEQQDHEPLARIAPGEHGERRRAHHDGSREHRDEQPDLRLRDAELGGHVGQQSGGKELTRDRDEDGPGEHEQTEEREACALSHGRLSLGAASPYAGVVTATATHWIVTLVCEDRPGIVHAVSGAIVQARGNITESQQFSSDDTGTFFMRLQVETVASREEFEAALEPVTERYGMTVAARRRRTAPAHPRARLEGRALPQRPAVPPARRPAAGRSAARA